MSRLTPRTLAIACVAVGILGAVLAVTGLASWPLLAIARTRPPRMCGSMELELSKANWMRPAIRSVAMGGEPRYGTCSMSMVAACFSISMPICAGVPLPPEP